MKRDYRLPLAIAGTALLVGLAFFLPDRISRWKDGMLLDSPKIIEEEGQEGFAESIRLTMPEKLRLIRSRNHTAVILPEPELERAITAKKVSEGWSSVHGVKLGEAALQEGDDEEAQARAESAEEWSRRLVSALMELRALQRVGAMPTLWPDGSEVALTNHKELLCVDNDTQVTFLVYDMELTCSSYTLSLSVDAQTGKFLSVSIRWTREGDLTWSGGDVQNFGTAWRDYWGMDGAELSYLDSQYIRGLLMETNTLGQRNGDYTSTTEVSFTYDGQSIRIPLRCRAIGGRECSIQWNM